MKFCSQCNNILYIKELENKLVNHCKICGNMEDTDQYIIYEKKYTIKKIIDMNVRDIIYDPGYPRTIHKKCPNDKCPSIKNSKLQESIFIENNNTLKLTYICTECLTQWSY
jgi:DNA-directed RNA polymerase subunit M/transcription elongation factor TFIIS